MPMPAAVIDLDTYLQAQADQFPRTEPDPPNEEDPPHHRVAAWAD